MQKIGRFLEHDFRVLPRFSAFEATQTKIIEFRPLLFSIIPENLNKISLFV